MYKLKQIPEDFHVEELFDPKVGEGRYLYVLLGKKNLTTLEAISKLSKFFGLPIKNFGFAGSKDKKAVTKQHISILGLTEARLKNARFDNIGLKILGRGDVPISLGDHEGNSFVITVRNLDDEDCDKVVKKVDGKKRLRFINYFGEQRFGSNNVKIGKAIMRKDWKKVCEYIDSRSIKEYLNENKTDFVGAVRTLPVKQISMYIHAYQSLLWNECASTFKDEIIPIPGFATEFKNKDIKKFVEEKLGEDGFTFRNFIIREIPNLFTEGGERKREVCAGDLTIVESDDDLNPGMKKVVLSFSLEKGSYATVFIESLFQA